MTDDEITRVYEVGRGRSHQHGLRAVYDLGRAAVRPVVVTLTPEKPARKKAKRRK